MSLAREAPKALAVALLLAALTASAVQAQVTIEGHVVDAETADPLEGANVLLDGTTFGTTTNSLGRFDVRADGLPRVLVISMMGYLSRSVEIADASRPIRVELEPRSLDLRPIIVSASREEEYRTDAPIAIAAISAREMEPKRPNMLHEALRTLPGVHVTNLGNEQHNMSIRQPLSHRALYVYLEDGIPVRPTGIFNHSALIELNMAGAERIEVVRGPSSSLYGSNAIGGAINFITPRPSSHGQGAISVRTDNHGYQRGDFRASSTFGRLGAWVGGYLARQRNGWAEHSDYSKVSLTLRTDYAFAPATRLITTYSANYLDTDTNGNLDSLNFYSRGFTSLQTFTYREVEAHRLTSRLQRVWSRRHSTDAAVYWRGNAVKQLPHYRIRNIPKNPGAASGELNADRFWSLGTSIQHRAYFDVLEGRLLSGITFDRSPNRYVAYYVDIARDPLSGRYVDYTRGDSLLTDYQVALLNGAAYLQLDVSPLRRLKLVASLRYDRIDYVFDNHLPPSAFSGAPDEEDRFSHVSPRAGLTFDLGGGSGIYGNVSRGFLPPEVSELYRGVKVPTLRPSIFDSYEIGGWTSLVAGRVNLEASLYRMDGTNEIVAVRGQDGDVQNLNAGKTRHIGVELAVAYTPIRSISVQFSGTHARHTFIRYEDRGAIFDGNEMDAAPCWKANTDLTYRLAFLQGAHVGVEWQRLGSYYMDPQNTMRYGGYHLLNLRLAYTMRRGPDLWLSVRNLTNELYANIASKTPFGHQYNPGAPRSVGIGLGYRFGRR